MKDAKSLLSEVLKELEHWRKNYPGGDQTGPRRDISHELEYEIKTYLKSEPLVVDFDQLRPSGYPEAPGVSGGDWTSYQRLMQTNVETEEVSLLRKILAALENK